MKIIIEDHDYINLITPFRNGCNYRMIVENQTGDFYLDYGCFPIFISGELELYFHKLLQQNKEQPIKLNISEELKSELLKMKPCECCGGLRFKM